MLEGMGTLLAKVVASVESLMETAARWGEGMEVLLNNAGLLLDKGVRHQGWSSGAHETDGDGLRPEEHTRQL